MSKEKENFDFDYWSTSAICNKERFIPGGGGVGGGCPREMKINNKFK